MMSPQNIIAPAVLRAQLVDLQQEVEIDATGAALLDDRLALAEAEVERLVAADVEGAAREVRQQFGVHLPDERERSRVARVERERRQFGPRQRRAARRFGEVVVRLLRQPAVHVPERVLVGHELDVPLGAVRVEREDLLAGHRRCVLPDGAMAVVREGVLDVQLELVDLPLGQHVDQAEQRRHRRHLVAADVEHDAAMREVGMVLDVQLRESLAVLADELRERREAMREARRVARDDADALVADGEVVALALLDALVDRGNDALALRQPRCRADLPSHAGVSLDGIAQPLRRDDGAGRRCIAEEDDRAVLRQRVRAAG